MKTRVFIVTAVALSALGTVLTFFYATSDAQQKDPFEQKEIPVVLKSIKGDSGGVLADIECEPIFITKPDTLEHFSCVLINKSTKSIRASGVLYTLIVESDGKQGRSGRIDVANRFVHPDMVGATKLLEPGEKQFVSAPLPMSERDIVIKGLEFEPVYLEFSDGTSVGTNADSIRLIKQLREGAAWFKEMLRTEYLREGKSIAALLPSLQEGLSSDSQGSWTGTQRRGANSYRRFLLEAYHKNGALAISKILEEK